MFKGTLGQALINTTLPKPYRMSGNFGTQEMKSSLINLAKDNPDRYAEVVPQIKQLGDEFSTYEGLSVGLDDIEPDYGKRDPILKRARSAIMKTKDISKINDILINTQYKIKEVSFKHKGDMALMARSGAKGNINQLMKAIGTPVVIGDAKGVPTPYLIERGYSEGLSPAEGWIGAVEARAQAVTSRTSVSGPGEMQKVMANMMSPLVVSESDCGTPNGILMGAKEKEIEGRYLSGSNSYVNSQKRRDVSRKGGKVKVRSALTCESHGGICQKCAGRNSLGKDIDVGVNLGIQSSQAITEPLTQMSLSARHAVSLVEGEQDKPTGLKAFKQLVEMPESFFYKASIAEKNGKVDSIQKAPQGGFDLKIDGAPHYVPPNRGLKVKLGQQIERGDVLSKGIPNPADIMKHKGIGAGREYLARSLGDLYKDEGIKADPKHFEYLAKAQFNYVKADEPLGDFLPGEIIPYNEARKALNDRGKLTSLGASIGKVLTQPVLQHMPGTPVSRSMLSDIKDAKINKIEVADSTPKFTPVAMSATRTPLLNPNWMQRIGYRYQKNTILGAAITGEKAEMSGYNPIPGLLTGEVGRREKGKY